MGGCCAKNKGTLERPGPNPDQKTRNRTNTHLSYKPVEDHYTKYFSFNDYRGFKKVKDINENYKLGDVLGKGTFGVVKRADHTKAKFVCAVKMIDKKKLKNNSTYFELMQNELLVL